MRKTQGEKALIEKTVRGMFAAEGYTDEKAAREILKEHHIDVSVSWLRLFRLGVMNLKQRERRSGEVRVTLNLETAEGNVAAARAILDGLEQRARTFLETDAPSMRQALDNVEEKLKTRPHVSAEERQALEILKRRKP